MPIPTLSGIEARSITTSQIRTRVLFSGAEGGVPVLFLHGNASSATFWEETMLALPPEYRAIAPDQRGYGDADRNFTINATRGLGDLADDAVALLDHLRITKAHIVGHSLGGAVVWNLLMRYPERFLSAVQVDPGSPFGFGGTKGVEGTKCFVDCAGSGAGVVNAAFAEAMGAGDRSSEPGSPRTIMLNYYFKPPFKPAREEELLSSVLSEHVGPTAYPGDSVPSINWPNVAPGVYGPANALSPMYAGDVTALYRIERKPRILWIRGADDQIVSDQSLFDVGTLGQMGAMPDWPGEEVFPPQPMVSQTRHVLDQYAEAGGIYEEVVIVDAGHTPFIEKPVEFNVAFHAHLAATTRVR